MSSLIIDLMLCGLAYVVLIYFMATMTNNAMRRRGNRDDEGDGGIEDYTPPTIDLPPGVIWPSDSPKAPKIPETLEY